MSLFEAALKKALLKAAEDGDAAQVAHLVEDRGVSPLVANPDGWTAVHFAVMRGHIDVMMYLISQGASVTTANIRGLTPLHLAAFHDHTNIIQALMKAGASTTLHQKDQDGNTPSDWMNDSNTDDALHTTDVNAKLEKLSLDTTLKTDSDQEVIKNNISSSSSSTGSVASDDEESIDTSRDAHDEERADKSLSEVDSGQSGFQNDVSVIDRAYEKPEVAWMSSILSGIKSNMRVEEVNDDGYSETSSSMSESDLIDPYAFKKDFSEADDIEDVSNDGRMSVESGMQKSPKEYSRKICDPDEDGDNSELELYNDSESMDEEVEYDRSCSFTPSEFNAFKQDTSFITAKSNSGLMSNVRKESQQKNSSIESSALFQRHAISWALKTIRLLRNVNALDGRSVGVLKDKVFSSDPEVLDTLTYMLAEED